jgi:methyl-galactoside transport system substrate-binding protein
MKRIAFLALCFLVLGSGVFAGGQKDSAGSDGKVVIGALIRNLDEQFLADYTSNIRKLAEEKGVDLKVLDSRSDQAAQLDQLNLLLTQGVRHFIIIPNQTEATEQMTKAIHERGGTAVFSNTPPSADALKVGKKFFLADSAQSVAGYIQADIIDEYFTKYPERLSSGKTIDALLILGQLGHPAQIARSEGLEKGLASKGYTLNVLAKDTANWKPDEAQQKMDAWLSAFSGRFNMVITQNDGMALGAVESMLASRYIKDDKSDGTVLRVPVLGVDATQVALQSIHEDKLYATVLQDSVGISTTAFELAYALASGSYQSGMVVNGIAPLDETISDPPANDPAVVDQCYLVPFKPVTKDNYQEFMN